MKKRRRPKIKIYKRIPLKWMRWLKTVQNDAMHLRHLQDVFCEAEKLLYNNPKLKNSKIFGDFLKNTYVPTVTLGVRRIVDTHKNSISLIKLMWEIYDNCNLLSRNRYVRLYKGAGDILEKQCAHGDYDRIVGKRLPCLTKRIVQSDIIELKNDKNIQAVRIYVNKVLAHRNVKPLRRPACYGNLNKSLDIMEDIIKRYSMLLYAQGWSDLTPVIQGNWKQVFEEPWISKNNVNFSSAISVPEK